jgi:ABC-2 type transport system permease protein
MNTVLIKDGPNTLAYANTRLIQRSFVSELRALWVMAKKEWVIFVRYPSWIAAFLIWPLLFPVGAIFTAKALSGPGDTSMMSFASLAGTTEYMAYIIIGLSIYMWLNVTLWDVGFQLRNEQMRGTLESNWLCPIWRFSILLGPSLTKLLTSLFFLAAAAIEYRFLFGINVVNGNLALILLVMLLTIPTIYGIGVIFGSLVIRFKEANTMVFLVRGIFMIFTGTSYPLAVLPDWMQAVAKVLPLTYTIQAIRAVSLHQATFFDILPELQILAGCAIVVPLLGYVIFNFVEKRARRTGSLAQY